MLDLQNLAKCLFVLNYIPAVPYKSLATGFSGSNTETIISLRHFLQGILES